jgi:hypothetical protein
MSTRETSDAQGSPEPDPETVARRTSDSGDASATQRGGYVRQTPELHTRNVPTTTRTSPGARASQLTNTPDSHDPTVGDDHVDPVGHSLQGVDHCLPIHHYWANDKAALFGISTGTLDRSP